MPGVDKPKPHGLIEYLVYGTKDADKRNNALEVDRQTGPWVPATIINGYAAPDPPMQSVKYRLDMKTDSLEFSGHLDVGSASSGDIAFYLMRPFWRGYDITFLTDVYDASGPAFNVARVSISSVDGAVSVEWPVIV